MYLFTYRKCQIYNIHFGQFLQKSTIITLLNEKSIIFHTSKGPNSVYLRSNQMHSHNSFCHVCICCICLDFFSLDRFLLTLNECESMHCAHIQCVFPNGLTPGPSLHHHHTMISSAGPGPVHCMGKYHSPTQGTDRDTRQEFDWSYHQ